MKRKIIFLMLTTIIVFSVIECVQKEELLLTPYTAVDGIVDTSEETSVDECSEGYVYDYQVSMEPISEEIAVWGGEVCGMIHAYPTEIEAALLKKEIDTGKEFTIKIRASYSQGVSDDVVAVSTYDYEDVVEDYKDDLKNIITSVVPEVFYERDFLILKI